MPAFAYQALDASGKTQRLAQWCEDATAASRAEGGPAYHFVYVDLDGFARYRPDRFAALVTAFRDFQQAAP